MKDEGSGFAAAIGECSLVTGFPSIKTAAVHLLTSNARRV